MEIVSEELLSVLFVDVKFGIHIFYSLTLIL